VPKSTKKIRKIKEIPPRTTVQSGRYLDYSASVMPNPSSIHALGVEAKAKLENARSKVAGVLSARPSEIIFTSGGTESNNLAIQGAVLAWQGSGVPHIITTNIEHPSVLETFKLLAKRKLAQISIVPVEKNGIVDPKKIKKEIKKNTVLVSVMYANNEIGTIQPIREIAKEIRHYRNNQKGRSAFSEHGYFSAEKFLVLAPSRSQVSQKALLPFFHTDAVQVVNYLDLNVDKLGVDLLSLSGSKVEGAGRVGVLYKKKSVPLENIFGGGDQEMGLRPGTENLPAIMDFADALESAQKIKNKEVAKLSKLRDYFMAELLRIFYPRGSHAEGEGRRGKKFEEAKLIINGDLKNRLPSNINVTFPKIPSDLLVIELSARGVMASSKSACKSSRKEGSYVIKAVNPDIDPEIGGVRFSFGRQTKKSDIDYTLKILSLILTKLKKWYN